MSLPMSSSCTTMEGASTHAVISSTSPISALRPISLPSTTPVCFQSFLSKLTAQLSAACPDEICFYQISFKDLDALIANINDEELDHIMKDVLESSPVKGLWDVQENGDEGCTVRVYSNVAFSKKTIFRGKIEQSTKEECREVYGIWIQNAHELLKQKIAKQEDSSVQGICIVQNSDARSHISEPEDISEMLHQTIPSDMQDSPPYSENHDPLIENAIQERLSWTDFGCCIIKEIWMATVSYFKSESHLPLVLVIIGLATVLVLMQISIIALLTRAPEVHIVTQGSSIGGPDGYGAENVEWLEKRFSFLKEEMLMVETRLERMRHEHAILKMHVESLEQVVRKS